MEKSESERRSLSAHAPELNEKLLPEILLQELMEHLPVMIYVVDNRTQCIQWCNTYLQQYLGYSLDEITSMKAEFFKTVVHADDLHITHQSQQRFASLLTYGGMVRVYPKLQKDPSWVVGVGAPCHINAEGVVDKVICTFLSLSDTMATSYQYDSAFSYLKMLQQDIQVSQLTEREREIVRLVMDGNSNKSIADSLNLSRHTIETHRKNIRMKLNVHSTSELIATGRRLGIA
jgi:DNA-binding CsgD family transcriptional regulator